MRKNLGLLLLCGAAALAAPAAYAQQAATRDYDIAAQSLGAAINQLAVQSGRQIIVADELVRGLRAPRLHGRYPVETALEQLLAGSGLHAVMVGNTFVVQRSDAPGQDAQGGEILVTGTRIRGRGPVGSAVVTIDRKAIDESGYATVTQLLQAIPQNFGGGPSEAAAGGTLNQSASLNTARGSSINLRGLGPSSTLVLLNGDRPALGGPTGVFADVSMIPTAAIARIEVVPDGASAVYGSDAVAGVVNLIPRLDFTGAETSFRIGTADGAFTEYGASQLLGTRWSGGRMMIALETYRRGPLAAADRDFATDDLRAFGGPDRRGTYANPGTITAGGRTYAIPAGQNGTGLTAAMLTAGTVNRGDSWSGADLLPKQRRHSVFAAVRQDLFPGLSLYLHGLATVRDFDGHVRPSSDATRTVPVTNPFYVDPVGTLQPIGVQYSFVRDLGPEGVRGKVFAFSGTAGLS
ncbi:MAG: TonB-dependent receptor plug domain-containing protein, partial [Sphingomonas sp.]